MQIGFIGVGAMGGPMAGHLLRAGHDVRVFDTSPERAAACVAEGASAADSAAAAVTDAEVVCLSLPSSDAFVRVAEQTLLPNIGAGQIVIDFGTVVPTETRRVAALLAERGAALVDAPVSGGEAGAKAGRLLMFVGGDPEIVERIRPLLETVGGAAGITCCGPAGSGQVVKGVNQLAMGLGAAAYAEAVAFGVLAGVDAETIGRAVGGADRWRGLVAGTAARAAQGEADQIGVKFRELPYFLREAKEQGFPLPLTETLYAFCDAGERVVIDDNRAAPSFWNELTKGKKDR